MFDLQIWGRTGNAYPPDQSLIRGGSIHGRSAFRIRIRNLEGQIWPLLRGFFRLAALYSKAIRVAFLGYPALHKGWPVFQMLLDAAGGDPDYEFYYIGDADVRDARLRQRRVRVSNDMRSAMTVAVAESKIDYAIIWSLCPETFCLTAHEAYAGGAQIITNRDSGNVASMVLEHTAGLVLNDERELLELMKTGGLKARPNGYQSQSSIVFSNIDR